MLAGKTFLPAMLVLLTALTVAEEPEQPKDSIGLEKVLEKRAAKEDDDEVDLCLPVCTRCPTTPSTTKRTTTAGRLIADAILADPHAVNANPLEAVQQEGLIQQLMELRGQLHNIVASKQVGPQRAQQPFAAPPNARMMRFRAPGIRNRNRFMGRQQRRRIPMQGPFKREWRFMKQQNAAPVGADGSKRLD